MSYEDKDALLYLADVRIDELQVENAKLRDFIRQIWPMVEHPVLWCHGCPHYKECMTPSDDGRVTVYRGGCQWREDMRETARALGIEVGE